MLQALLACLLSVPLLQGKSAEVVRESYPDGSPRSKCEVVRAKDGRALREGEATEWHPNGQVAAEGRYTKDLRVGVWEGRDEQGRLRWRGRYERGARSGKWTFWDEQGVQEAALSGEYELEIVEDAAGRPQALGYRLEGRRSGAWRFLWPDGRTQFCGRYRNGVREGTWVFYHSDGAPAPLLLSGVYDGGRWDHALEPEALAAFKLEPEEGLEEALARRRADTKERAPSKAASPPDWGGDWARRLAELEALDLADPEVLASTAKGKLFPSWLAELGCQRGFGWSSEASPAGLALRREVVRSLRSLWELKRDDPVYWLLDLQDRARADELLCRPPLWVGDRSGAGGDRSTLAYFADRFAERSPKTFLGGAAGVAALEQALAWLARHQSPSGLWQARKFLRAQDPQSDCGCDRLGEDGYDVGCTALALLALLGDGHTPYRGAYAPSVVRGLHALLGQQSEKDGSFRTHFLNEDGNLVYRSSYMYEHALATMALAEAYALTGHELLGRHLRRAVIFLQKARNPYAGWRYSMPPTGDNDSSVTSWALQALHAAREAGVEVDPQAFEGGLAWLDEMGEPSTGRCGYDAMGSLSARIPGVNDDFEPRGEAMTAAYLYCQLLLGREVAQYPHLLGQVALLRKSMPEWDEGRRWIDMVYWYFGAHAFAQYEGKERASWLTAVADALMQHQRKEGDLRGSWDPDGPWGFAGGRVYATAMAALTFESTYRVGRKVPAPAKKKR